MANIAQQSVAPQAQFPPHFLQQYESHLRHLELKGLQPKTIDAYARGVRRIGEYFSYQVDALGADDLAEYFTELKASHSWSGVKLDLYGWKFFTEHVLRRPWAMPDFIRPPKASRLPDIVSVEQAQALFDATCAWLNEPGAPRRIVTLGDPDYPPALLETADPRLTEALLGQIRGKKIVKKEISDTALVIFKSKVQEVMEAAEKLEMIVKLIR